jgi:hypothetical protein
VATSDFFPYYFKKFFIGRVPLKNPITSIGPMLLSVHCSAFSLSYAHKSHNFEENIRKRDNDEMAAAAKNYSTTEIFLTRWLAVNFLYFFRGFVEDGEGKEKNENTQI